MQWTTVLTHKSNGVTAVQRRNASPTVVSRTWMSRGWAVWLSVYRLYNLYLFDSATRLQYLDDPRCTDMYSNTVPSSQSVF